MKTLRAREDVRLVLVLKAVLGANVGAYERLLREAEVADEEGLKEMRYLMERNEKMRKQQNGAADGGR